MSILTLTAGVLASGSDHLVEGMHARLGLEAGGPGAFLVAASEPGNRACRIALPFGRIAAIDRWTALHRYEPFWMMPTAGAAGDPLPRFEIQHALVRRSDGRFLLIVPLAQGRLRWSLEQRPDGLHLVGETGDPHTAAEGGLAAYVAVGDDPYELWPQAAAVVSARLGTGRLRREKILPGFVDDFGWCTWDAFYQEVDAAKVAAGLDSWRQAGISPRFLILDDGWQCEERMPGGERRLTGLGTNPKFPGGLAPLVRMAKDEHGIRTVLVWHAVIGYWGGVDGGRLPDYGVRDVGRRFTPGLYHSHPTIDDWWGHLVGVVSPQAIARFYNDYHAGLRRMGVDGVKVDNQAVLEGVCTGVGDRVGVTRAYREALEGSVALHFHHRLINCMSHATETWYQSLTSNIIRTSTDFWPKRPETHGLHLYTNAQVCGWFGEFMHGDWDMFQSGHEMGAYHAAGRAVSGSPVYCSDKPGTHDAAVLRRLVCSDGTVLRFADPGRPGRSSLLHDPTREDVPLTIVNRCPHGAAIGVFHARYQADAAKRTALTARLGAGEVPGLAAGRYVLWRHLAGSGEEVGSESTAMVRVEHGAYEVCTLAPIDGGRALIGPRGRYVPVLAIRSAAWTADAVEAVIRDGGEVVLWGRRPQTATVDGTSAAIAWDEAARTATIRLPPGADRTLRVTWA